MELKSALADNFVRLKNNSYPGRGLVVGVDETGENLVQIAWLTGRSENSRNRIYKIDGGRLYTEAADPKKVTDPSLIFYDAMLDGTEGLYVVSNGAHTGAFADGISMDVLSEITYEPDEPRTPRILGISHIDGSHGIVIWKSASNGRLQNHLFGYEGLPHGVGMCIHTYQGDGNPPPSFEGEPYSLPLLGDSDNIAAMYWQALNVDNRVALAVKTISIETRESSIKVLNRYSKYDLHPGDLAFAGRN